MNSNTKLLKLYFTLDFLILILSAPGIYNFSQKADLPFKVRRSEGTLLAITDITSPQINSGDTIISIDKYPLRSRDEVEVYLDSKKIGDIVNILVSKKSVIQLLHIEVRNF